jgi:hypothetical protein
MNAGGRDRLDPRRYRIANGDVAPGVPGEFLRNLDGNDFIRLIEHDESAAPGDRRGLDKSMTIGCGFRFIWEPSGRANPATR